MLAKLQTPIALAAEEAETLPLRPAWTNCSSRKTTTKKKQRRPQLRLRGSYTQQALDWDTACPCCLQPVVQTHHTIAAMPLAFEYAVAFLFTFLYL